jgi:hypothetical protein
MNGAWAGVVDAAAGTDGRSSSADAEVSAEPYAVQLVERHACLGDPCRPQGIVTQFCNVMLAGYYRAPATGAIFLSVVPPIYFCGTCYAFSQKGKGKSHHLSRDSLLWDPSVGDQVCQRCSLM